MPSAPAVEPPAQRLSSARDDLGLVGRLGRLEHDAGRAGIGDDRHGVVGAELVDQQREGALEQRQLVGLVHRARGIEQEDEVARLVLGDRGLIALDADVEQLGLGVPRRRIDRDGRLERRLGDCRAGIVVVEIVDQLLDAHGVGGRDIALLEGRADVGSRTRCRRRSRRSRPAPRRRPSPATRRSR